jgi:hypothetical protein
VNPEAAAAVYARIDSMASDLGRLSRLLPDDPMTSYATMLVGRLAHHMLLLDALLGPCASELCLISGFHADGVEASIAAVDERDVGLRRLLAPANLGLHAAARTCARAYRANEAAASRPRLATCGDDPCSTLPGFGET